MQKMKSGIKYAILWAVLVVAGAAFVITGAKEVLTKMHPNIWSKFPIRCF